MLQGKSLIALVVAAIVGMIVVGQAVSQDARPATPDRTRRGAGDAGGRTRRGAEMTPERMAEFRERMAKREADRMTEKLGITADEWKVLAPRVQKVQTLLRDAQPSRMMMGGRRGRGGRGGAANGAEVKLSPVQTATEALRKLLEDKAANAPQIKSKLADLRKAREKARQELAVARKALRDVLSVRQEAQMSLDGILD